MAGTAEVGMPAMWLRAAIMFVGGILGVFWSEAALATLALIGGAIMVIDGGLGLWRLAFGQRSGQFWSALVRSLLAMIAGVLVLAHPALAAAIGLSVLIDLVAALMLVAGLIELYLVFRERASIPRGGFLGRALGGIIYVVVAVLLFFLPLTGAIAIVRIGSVLLIIYGAYLAYAAWQSRSA